MEDEGLGMPTRAELPADVFEALVAGWTELLVADYQARHGCEPSSETQQVEDHNERMICPPPRRTHARTNLCDLRAQE